MLKTNKFRIPIYEKISNCDVFFEESVFGNSLLVYNSQLSVYFKTDKSSRTHRYNHVMLFGWWNDQVRSEPVSFQPRSQCTFPWYLWLFRGVFERSILPHLWIRIRRSQLLTWLRSRSRLLLLFGKKLAVNQFYLIHDQATPTLQTNWPAVPCNHCGSCRRNGRNPLHLAQTFLFIYSTFVF